MKKTAPPVRSARRRSAAPLTGARKGAPAALWESLLASQDELDGGFVLCREARPVYVSDGLCRLAGSSREEVMEIPDVAVLFADDERVRSAVREAAARRAPGAPFESRLAASGIGPGRFVDVALRGVGARGDVLLVVRDVTGRRALEEQLRLSEERRRTLFEEGADAILQMRGPVIIDANERALAMFGVQRDGLLGKSACDFSPPRQGDGVASYEAWRVRLEAALRGERQLFEWKHERRDGTLFDVEICLTGAEIGGERLAQAVLRDITDRKRAEDALRKYEFIANTTGSLMSLVDRDYRYVAANNAYCVAQGKERADLIGRTMGELWGEELFRTTLKPAVDECLKGRSVNYEASFRFPSDGVKIYDVTYSPYWQHEGGWYVTHVVVVSHDITQRRLAEQTLSREEDRLRTSLDEKEVLLKEIHHRVKNNLQVVSSLLNLQSGYVRDSGDVEMFRESQNRIRSMALIHEKLYQSGNVSVVDFPQYARSLATTLFRSYRADEGNVSLEVDFGDVALGIDAAVPCGLIINELLSNALKHAFPAGRAGKVLLGLRTVGGKMRLTVGDDGVGFPRGVDVAHPESLGLQLVNTLVAQIGGVLEVDRTNGTEFRIAFAPPEERRHPV